MADEKKPSPLPSIPPPPRIEGVIDTNTRAILEWMLQQFSWLKLVFDRLDPANGLGASDAIEDVIDPASATAATAQQTANDAKLLATAANNRSIANRNILRSFGTFDLSDTATSVEVTFPEGEEQPNATYTVIAQAQSFTGTPAFEAFVPVQYDKLTDKFTMHVSVAPGSGNTVSYAWHIRRKDEDT
ncbi:MAG: hypothetical protein Unbinned664contig1000_43 [Prokaryotic dsDNA virus sp.]|nr:MAG: hypothetical protein Unbinned664contig1000_43 [Prokaryotic dsDNA virus sp.]|tara:strand:- start:2158 stop:2718 length:561 start_codon:yes stop_codon:yes gene_type:complete